jgi:hypothetical protein
MTQETLRKANELQGEIMDTEEDIRNLEYIEGRNLNPCTINIEGYGKFTADKQMMKYIVVYSLKYKREKRAELLKKLKAL